MSHLVETMAYANETPWHSLGVKVPADLSPAQMAEKAGVNWTVEKIPAFAEIGGAQTAVGWSALVRSTDHRILDIVSNDWIPNQNDAAFEFFHEFCELGQMNMDTAGSLDGGRVVWALAKINESFEVFGGDQVDSYMLFTNPHRFGQSIDVRFTPIRVVCNNTLTLALNSKHEKAGNVTSANRKNSVRQTHRTEFDAEKVKKMMGMASHKLRNYKEAALFLGTKEYTDELLARYMGAVLPKAGKDNGMLSSNAALALSMVETQPGAEFARNTWWQAFNAVTYVVDHEMGRTDDTRMKSAWYGQGRSIKLNALNLALAAAEGKLEEVTA